MLRMTLKHRKNPDINGGYWGFPVDRKPINWTGATMEEARVSLRAWIDRNELGFGNVPPVKLLDETGKTLGQFSYNGRLWDEQGKEIQCAS